MTKKINILHLDDSKSIQLYIRIMLMEIASIKTIKSAATIRKAREILKTDEIDLAILDIDLPDGNGLALCGWIKKRYPLITVIMFSNNSDPFFRKAARKYKADYFLDKSMEFEDLITILKKHTPNYSPSYETSL